MLPDSPPKTSMPVKWKIFRFINYFQVLFTTAILVLLAIAYSSGGNFESPGWILVFVFIFLVIMANCFFNLHLMSRYFPDQPLPTIKERTATFFLIIFILITAAGLLICIAGVISESSEREPVDNSGLIALGIFSFYCIINLLILILQAGLPLYIERRNKTKMRDLIDEIGNSANQ